MSTTTSGAGSVRRSLWLLLAVACFISATTFGLRSAFGFFIEPVSDANGWTREVFALSVALQNLCWGIGQPLAGPFIDRYGPTRVFAVGGTLFAAGMALMSFAGSPLSFHLTSGVLVGLGMGGASYITVLAALTRVVPEEKRSWALGIGTAAGSFGQFALAPLGQAFIAGYGWQTAALLLAGLVALVPVLALSFWDDGTLDDAGRAGDVDLGVAETVRRAFGHPSYVLLVTGFFVCGFQLAFMTTHLPAYLGDSGISPAVAGWALGLIGLFNMVGAYAAGALGARLSKSRLLSGIYLGRAAAIAIFVTAPISPATTLVFAAVVGLLWLSAAPPTSGLVATMFGVRYMGTLFGIVFFSHQLGSFSGAWLGGALYDRTGSYDVVWWMSVGLGVAAAALHLPIKDRPAALTPA